MMARLLPQHIQTKPQNQVRPSLSLGQSFPPLQITSRYCYLFGWEKCAGFSLLLPPHFPFSFFPDMALFVFHSSPPFPFLSPLIEPKIAPQGGRREKGRTSEKTKSEFNDRPSTELVFPRETVLVVKETSAKK